VADILHVSPKTVSRWAKEGKLPFLKTLGGHRRYPAVEIRQLAAELQVQPTTWVVQQVMFWRQRADSAVKQDLGLSLIPHRYGPRATRPGFCPSGPDAFGAPVAMVPARVASPAGDGWLRCGR
jgi:excisionase family DNA binding protein